MPVYEFTCPNKHRFEVELGIDDPRPDICEECGETLYRVFSPPNVKYSTPGFYSTDMTPPSEFSWGKEANE